MDRELLLEIGVEELPAAWLPGLTKQLAEKLQARLKEMRLTPDAPIESFSTPRRLTARIGRMPERQEDLDETITGPPVSAAFNAAGEPTPAALGFAKKQGVAFDALERVEDGEGRVPGRQEAPPRQEHGRRAARAARGAAARLGVPQADALGRDARGRPRRAPVRPADPLAAVSLRRPRRPLQHRPHAERGRQRRSRRSRPAR